MARLFIAVRPPEHVVEILRSLPRKDQRGVRFVPPDNWHVTLRFLGEADPDVVAETLGRVCLPAAVAHVGPSVDFLGRHSVIAPVAGLDAIASAVTRVTADLGEPIDAPRFVGHITLARVRRGAIVRKVIGMNCSAVFDVDGVELIESRLRPTGARYHSLASWPTGSSRHAS